APECARPPTRPGESYRGAPGLGARRNTGEEGFPRKRPQFEARPPVVSGEVDVRPRGGEFHRIGRQAARCDVLEQPRSRRRTVAAPGLEAVDAVGGREEEDGTFDVELPGVGGAGSRQDVLDDPGAGLRAVAHPQLVAAQVVVIGEPDLLPEGGQRADSKRRVPGGELADEARPCRVVLPELVAGGRKEQGWTHHGERTQTFRARPRNGFREPVGPCFRAIAAPQLLAVLRGGPGEKESSVPNAGKLPQGPRAGEGRSVGDGG